MPSPTHDSLRRVLLRQPTRKRIYDAIEATPGTHARALSRDLNLALGSVEHHVRQLEKHSIIHTYQAGRRRTLFVAGQVAPADAPLIHALRNDAWAVLLEELLGGEGGVSELARRLDAPVTSVSYHLRRMKDAGVLDHIRLGRESVYSVTHPRRVQFWLEVLRPEPEAPDAAFVGLVARAVVRGRGAAPAASAEAQEAVVLR